MIAYKSGPFLVGFSLLVACCVVAADNETEKTRYDLEKSFIELTDYLDSKLPNNDDPQANSAAVNQYGGGCMFKSDRSQAVSLFRTIANDDECNSTLFEAIKSVQKATQAQYKSTTRRADKVLKTFIDKALRRCDSYHEQALKEALSNMSPLDRTNIETLFDDEFIKAYKGKTQPLSHHLSFSYVTSKIRWSYVTELARAALIAAKGDSGTSLTLRADPQAEGRRPVTMAQVEYLCKKYIFDSCKAYFEATNRVFSYGKSAAKFLPGGEDEFLARRSDDYKNSLIRRHFCKDVNSDPEGYMRHAHFDYEHRL